MRTSGWVRSGPAQLPPNVKSTGGYLNPSLARLEAVRGGDHEAILLNLAGRVAEASAANVFALVDGVLVTPPVEEGILPGITRDALLHLAADLGIGTAQRPLAPAELRTADEVLLAGTAMEVVAVSTLDGMPVGEGKPGPGARGAARGVRRRHLRRAPGGPPNVRRAGAHLGAGTPGLGGRRPADDLVRRRAVRRHAGADRLPRPP
ncbi:hypothetical protein GCM10027184_17420 [Saccharothrix stipae]